jgi:hypothetical protein
MIDKILTRTGIGIALLLMVLELTYINAKSLFYLVNEFSDIDRAFSVIGSLAFSMVTVIVMRKSTDKWPKIAFPIFDALLVFCGLNLKYYGAIIAGTDNEMRFFLTIFIALFTGFITYCLGIINYKEHETEIKPGETEINSLLTQLNLLQGKYKNLESDFYGIETENYSLQTEIEKYKTQINSVKSEFNGKETELVKYRAIYLQSEKSRILKKKEENRTVEENEILNLAQ